MKESYAFLNGHTTTCEKQCQSKGDIVSELSSRFEARLATLEEAQIALQAQADKDHDRLVGDEKCDNSASQNGRLSTHRHHWLFCPSLGFARTSEEYFRGSREAGDRYEGLKMGFEEIRKRLAQFSQFVTDPSISIPSLPSNVTHVTSQTPNGNPHFANYCNNGSRLAGRPAALSSKPVAPFLPGVLPTSQPPVPPVLGQRRPKSTQ